ncbi:MAG TPA: hypothetical protein VNE40_00610 [Candidatus Dormibacteraeota bacterium]|nr:hypothetical protein [Candidatus Dormibacteraeota bacterium]
MAIICPTVTASDAHDFRTQMEQVEPLSRRIHIDLSDGLFAPRKLVDLHKIWWSPRHQADLHLMYRRPLQHIEWLVIQRPSLVIVHAEAEGDFRQLATALAKHQIKVGVALLPPTPVQKITAALNLIDHLLIFSGNLGYQGGSRADLNLLAKAHALKSLKPDIELGWDGGVNDQNVHQLTIEGIDVINAGGYISRSANPADAYAKLKAQT